MIFDGDMSGYVEPDEPSQFSIRYTPGMVAPGSSRHLSWAPRVFDDETFSNNGFTGLFTSTIPYSWSDYEGNLRNSIATMNTVTLTIQDDILNAGYTASDISFWWGNGNNSISRPTFLGTGIAPVPVPATFWLLGCGLFSLFGISRKNKKNKADQ